MLRGLGYTLWGKMGSHLWGKIGFTLSEVRVLSTMPGYWEGWVHKETVWSIHTGMGGEGVGGGGDCKTYV